MAGKVYEANLYNYFRAPFDYHHLSNSELTKIGKLPSKLIELCCFENNLTDISSIKDCRVLKILYISNNKICDLQILEDHQTLEILIANFNNITDIPRNIIYLKKIQIKNNKIKKIKSYPNLISGALHTTDPR